jgi:hypothetical protein
MKTEIDIASANTTVIRMKKDTVLAETEIETGTTTGDVTLTNGPTALKALVATTNDTDVLSLLGLTLIPPSNYHHVLMNGGGERGTIAQQTNWRVFCSLCLDSHAFVQLLLHCFSSLLSVIILMTPDTKARYELTIPMTCLA